MASNRPSSIEDYDVVKTLGSGAFGSVNKVIRRSDRKAFAMKKVQIGRMEEREVADALNECRILASVKHQRVVNFEAAFLARNGRELCLVMELCERGDLAGRIKKCQHMRRRVDERTIWANMVEMAEGIAHLHSKNIYHRDMKPANVFLAADGTAKLGDLNVSKLTKGDDLMQTKIGTPYYMAPEVWDGRKYDGACDVWSIGTVVYELAALEPPFQGQSLMQLKRAVKAGRYSPIPSSYSSELSRMIGLMLVTNPSQRLTAQEIVDHDMVKKRRATHLLSHPSAAPEEVDDTELLATIKPPKNRGELKGLASQLSQMSAQVATARSDSKSEAGGGNGGPARASEMRSKLGALSEEAPSSSANAANQQLPGSRFGNNHNNVGVNGGGRHIAGLGTDAAAPGRQPPGGGGGGRGGAAAAGTAAAAAAVEHAGSE
jgi:NIMA (never in mitosis gene a)-related kinase